MRQIFIKWFNSLLRRLAGMLSFYYREADDALDHPLMNRAVEILKPLSNELSNKQISDRLRISPAIVKRHAENVYHKLGVRDRRKAVARATVLASIGSR